MSILKKYLKSTLVARKTKLLMYNTLVTPSLTYDSETWVISKADERSLGILKRRVFLSSAWKKRYSHELYKLFNEPDVLSVYPCCSHLEHRASVKRFVSLQFLNLRQSVGHLGRGISPSQGLYLYTNTEKRKHPCFEWDLNPKSQCLSGRRYFMP
jgi:hypothetical protein